MSNALVLTQKALADAPNLKAVFEIEAFQHNWISNFVKTTGLPEAKGRMNFERERVLFMKKIQENPELEKCERFTIYSAFIELAASGLTLADDQAYIVPRGGKAGFMPGWKGRLEQLALLPQHADINPPKLVYESDEFDYEEVQGETRILKHKPNLKRDKGEKILFVYLAIEMQGGRKKIYLMDRESVLNIRDRRSDSYKGYVKACQEAGQDPQLGKPVKKQGRNGEYWMQPPFWITDEAQAWKKTLVKRVYNETPKTPRMKALDAKIESNYDPETGEAAETHDIDYGLAADTKELPEQTQAQQPAAAAEAPKERKTRTAKPKAETQPEVTPPAGVDSDGVVAEADVVHDDKEEQGGEENPAAGLPDLNEL